MNIVRPASALAMSNAAELLKDNDCRHLVIEKTRANAPPRPIGSSETVGPTVRPAGLWRLPAGKYFAPDITSPFDPAALDDG